MFGSYRIDNPRENRTPKLRLIFDEGEIQFYSCAIKVVESDFEESYDWTIDLMAKEWSTPKAVQKVKRHPREKVCDVLMDQEIFAGLGNIMKNEILFQAKLHPEAKVEHLSPSEVAQLVRGARAFETELASVSEEDLPRLRGKSDEAADGSA